MASRKTKIAELLQAALDCPEAERASFLRIACGKNEGLRKELESLLGADLGKVARLDGCAIDVLMEEGLLGAGDRIGPFEVEQSIGRGGMGEVYLASRFRGDFQQRVAVKVLKRGLETAELVRRFRTERQILARLKHPGIVTIHDGGATEDGRHYLVMDHVDGEPIDRYCDLNRLNIQQRLEVFRKVCDAVQLAHRNLVVHRDLKPGNILVTAEGQPKLLDFGIAKLMGPGDSVTTSGSLRIFTPEYASPEQIQGEPITTATDVYSLGIVLFEILVGRRPEPGIGSAEAEGLRKALGQRLEESPSLAETRGTEPRRLLRQVSGDLDRIVTKALSRFPEERYGSVEDFSRDLHAYTAGLPISARKPSRLYRTSKFLKRNKAVPAFFLAAVLLTGAYMLALVQERRETARQLRASQEISRFLLDLFEAPDPGLSQGSETSARDVLERAVERLDSELDTQPEVKARLLTLAGRTYIKLGLHEEATPLLEEAVAIRSSLPDSDLDLAESLDTLARALQEAAQYDRAEELLERSLALRKKRLEPSAREIAFSLNELAALAFDRGDFEKASVLCEKLVELDLAHRGLKDQDTATSIHNLGAALLHLGRLDEAESRLQNAMKIRLEILGNSHPNVADSLQELGLLYKQRGDLEKSLGFNRRALDLRLKVLGKLHGDTSQTMNNLAVLLRQMGRPEEALGFARDVVEIRGQLLGKSHPGYGLALSNLSSIYTSLQRYSESQQASQEAVAVFRNLDEKPVGHFAHSLMTLASALMHQGEYEAAAESLDEALVELGPAELPGFQVLAAIARSFKGVTLAAAGREEEAKQMLTGAHEELRELLGPEARPTREALERLERFSADRRLENQASDRPLRASGVKAAHLF